MTEPRRILKFNRRPHLHPVGISFEMASDSAWMYRLVHQPKASKEDKRVVHPTQPRSDRKP